MRSVLQLFWATLERAFPRVATAAVMLCFARFTSPESVGIYSWIALAYTLYQAVAETALRTLAVLSLRNGDDLEFVRRRLHRAAVFGTCLIGAALGVLVAVYPHQWQIVLGLTPFLAVPFVTTAHVLPSAYLQFDQQWARLARFQLASAAAALTVSLTVVLTVHSSAAMSLHALCTEAVFLALTRRAAASVDVPTDRPSRNPAGEARGMVAVSGLAWAQSQLERVFIGSLAGPVTLGLYATASTVGRSPGDALAMATANYVRSRVGRSDDPQETAHAVRNIGLLGTAVGGVLVVLLVALVDLVFQPFLGSAYAATLGAAPLFAVAAVPTCVSLVVQLMAVSSGRSRASVIGATVGLACSLPIGLLAVHSIEAAAVMVVAKEVAVLLVTYSLAKLRGAGLPVLAAVVTTGLALLLVLVFV